MIQNKQLKNSNLYKWSYLIFNDLILIMVIYFLTFGTRLNTGGIDGLSILTVQFLEFFFFKHKMSDIIITNFMIFYNILALLVGYKVFGKDFFYKTVVLVIILNFGVLFLARFFGDENQSFLLQIICRDNIYLKLTLASVVGGFFIGLALSNIRRLGYTTGGIDIFQKILKDICGINFMIVVFLTDGIIIFCSIFFESIKDFNLYYFLTQSSIRLFFSFLSILIIGFIMEKTSPLKNS
ncbi:YitT family protein [Candidatus Phytoplasma palmae]|uniref:YitT family protein n=1 Tax=Candidatus Phytoplasma palmae TaxID=85624 RepID=UPI00399096A2